MAAFPMPANHTAADFMTAHGKAANTSIEACATCHARELCETCHLDADSVAAIQSLGRDPRVAQLTAGRMGKWPLPESHRQPEWARRHGNAAAANAMQCATCHQQTDCLRCHSAKTGWRINPHGDDFDADRLGDRNLLMCSRCHFSDPRR